MGIFCTALFFLIACLGKLIRGKWFNLLTVFAGFYAIMIFLGNLQLFYLYPASTTTYTILMEGIIFFAFGYCLVVAIYQKRCKLKYRILGEITSYNNKYEFRKYVIYIIFVFVVSYSLYCFYKSYQLLTTGISYAELRSMYFDRENEFSRDKFDLFVYLPLLQSLVFISSCIFFVDTIELSFKTKSFFVVTVFLCEILSMFSNGGREQLFYMLFIFLYTYIVTYKNRPPSIEKNKLRNLIKNKKKLIWIGLIVSFIGMSIMTVMRLNNNINTDISDILQYLYIYCTGWLPHLSIRLEQISSNDYTYGYAFVNGLLRLPMAFFYRFGIADSDAYESALMMVSNLQDRIYIGSGITFNAYVSPFYYFYRDFGYVSVAIESMLFGLFCAGTETNYELNRSIKSLFWYQFAFFLIISSVVRWEMVHVKTGMIVYYSLLFFRTNKIKKIVS